jgi:hypothetical protein
MKRMSCATLVVSLTYHLAVHGLRRVNQHSPTVQGILTELHIDTIQHTNQLFRRLGSLATSRLA